MRTCLFRYSGISTKSMFWKEGVVINFTAATSTFPSRSHAHGASLSTWSQDTCHTCTGEGLAISGELDLSASAKKEPPLTPSENSKMSPLQTSGLVIHSIPTAWLLRSKAPGLWCRKGRRRKEDTREVGRTRSGRSVLSPGAYRLALVFVHGGLHLPDLLPIWKNPRVTDSEGTVRNQTLKTQTHQSLFILVFV